MPRYRRELIAALCDAPFEEVREVPLVAVRLALRGVIDQTVLEVATAEPAAYWMCRGRYFLDDPAFGPVIDFADLRYSPELGLYDSREGIRES